MSRKVIAHILLFLVNLFYGANFIVSKQVMPAFILPQAFILIRVGLTVGLFLLVGAFWGQDKIQRKDFPLLFLCSLFGVVINQELFFAGLNITTPINGALIMIMTPILVMLISFFSGHEKLTWQKVIGLILGTAGAFIIISGKGLNFSSKTALGDLLILLNASSFAIYLVIVRPLMKKYHPMAIIKWVFLLGLPWVVLFGAKQFSEIQWRNFSPTEWSSVAFVVLFATFCAYLFNIVALREVHSSVVGAYIYLQPILATLISIVLNRDHFTTEKFISAALIFSGVYFVSFAGRKNRIKAEEMMIMEE
ncbi:MAG: DMT family transporter [Bacteroidetes bacterium]|nr:DMT family transporter [Bacteroidota bacterium]